MSSQMQHPKSAGRASEGQTKLFSRGDFQKIGLASPPLLSKKRAFSCSRNSSISVGSHPYPALGYWQNIPSLIPAISPASPGSCTLPKTNSPQCPPSPAAQHGAHGAPYALCSCKTKIAASSDGSSSPSRAKAGASQDCAPTGTAPPHSTRTRLPRIGARSRVLQPGLLLGSGAPPRICRTAHAASGLSLLLPHPRCSSRYRTGAILIK